MQQARIFFETSEIFQGPGGGGGITTGAPGACDLRAPGLVKATTSAEQRRDLHVPLPLCDLKRRAILGRRHRRIGPRAQEG